VPERLGGNVIDIEKVSKAYGDKLLFEDLSFSLPPGGIVGVIGPNGAGKTTLFKLITGPSSPTAARSRSGRPSSSAMSTSRATISIPVKNVWEEISGGSDVFHFGKHEIGTRAYVGAFNFKGRTSRRRSACSRAASATGSISPRC
jgi:ATPase subunit of ABC transporter with duplicated ATPase domains